MKSNIFIPKKINVGYQNRSGTYTGKLAYIIYYDEKGVLRKERSWNGWRDEDIPNDEFDNEPTEGFVLNKKAGDYSTGWDHRQAYCRVYDPRGFEFEITIENLLYILANVNCYKGKGLEGEFVYGWSGKDLVLMPVESPDYKQIEEFNKIVHNNECIKAKDLIIGATYLTKDDEQVIYVGKFETYDYYGDKNKGKYFTFYHNGYFEFRKTFPKNKIITCIDDKCTEKYADIFEELEGKRDYSPYDKSKDEYVHYSFEEFRDIIKPDRYYSNYFISEDNDDKITFEVRERDGLFIVRYYIGEATDIFPYTTKMVKGFLGRKVEEKHMIPVTLEEIYKKMKPMYLQKYLANGREYERTGRL